MWSTRSSAASDYPAREGETAWACTLVRGAPGPGAARPALAGQTGHAPPLRPASRPPAQASAPPAAQPGHAPDRLSADAPPDLASQRQRIAQPREALRAAVAGSPGRGLSQPMLS